MCCYFLQDNYTPLHIAVESCKPAVVETLLGYGADVHIRGNADVRVACLYRVSNQQPSGSCAVQEWSISISVAYNNSIVREKIYKLQHLVLVNRIIYRYKVQPKHEFVVLKMYFIFRVSKFNNSVQ